MAREEAETIQSLTPGSVEESNPWYHATASVNILGIDYSQALLFNPDDILLQVNVSRKFVGGDTACTLEFNDVFGAVRARYGEPDQPPNRSVYGGICCDHGSPFHQSGRFPHQLFLNLVE
jgi:hypothetical protein